MKQVVCAVLAAGASTRLGRPKQLVRYRGLPLVRHVACEVSKVPFAAAAVVLGAVASIVDEALGALPIERLVNHAWREGLGSSIRVATGWASARHADALVLVLADQPLLDRAHLERLVSAFAAGAAVVASEYGNALAVPALFAASRFRALAALEGDRGASRILRQEAEVARIPWPEGIVDIDTETDALTLRASDRHTRPRGP